MPRNIRGKTLRRKKGSQSIQNKRKAHVGGFTATRFARFPLSAEQLRKYVSVIPDSSSDCVISALQILGGLDAVTANILRVTCVGKEGIGAKEIENIFTIISGFLYDFKPIDGFDTWIRTIYFSLGEGECAFCGGLRSETYGHVFILAKFKGELLYIDPRMSGVSFQGATFPGYARCVQQLPNGMLTLDMAGTQFLSGYYKYYVLFQSPHPLSESELVTIGFGRYGTFGHMEEISNPAPYEPTVDRMEIDTNDMPNTPKTLQTQIESHQMDIIM